MSNSIIQHSPQHRHAVERSTTRCTVQICDKTFALKRLFLPLSGTVALVTVPAIQDFLYLPVVVFFVSFILYWNFPILILFTNSRPLYYEDLFIDQAKIPMLEINPKAKKRFESIFEWTLIVTNSIFTAALADYWLYQTTSKQSYIEILGVTGGILKIFQFINHVDGSVILYVTKRLIKKELNKKKKIEMVKLDNTQHSVEAVEETEHRISLEIIDDKTN
jgi:hypothetical protein